MNANRHHHRRPLLAALAGAMLLAGAAQAAERGTTRPSAATAGAGSLPRAEVQDGDRRLPSRTRWTIAHQGDDGISPYGRTADPAAASSDRGGSSLPQAITGTSAELSGPCTAVAPDRHHDSFLEAEMLETFLLDLVDPFRCGTKAGGRSDWDVIEEDVPALITCDPMDLDIDGDVDFDDFKLLTTAFGTDEGDLDGDGIVDGADLGLMLVRMSLSIETAD